MIIKINYNKSTKQIVVSNDNKQILLSVTDSTIIDTDDELSFEIAGDLSSFQDMLTPNPMDEME
jgi:outer membrane lipoprotein-sorting protein